MSRFCKDELGAAIEDMERLLQEENSGKDPSAPAPLVVGPTSTLGNHHNLALPTNVNGAPGFQPNSTTSTDPFHAISHMLPPHDRGSTYVPQNLSERIMSTPTRPILRFSDAVLTPEVFPTIWAVGEPLLVTDVLHKFKIQWTPEYFIEKHGTQTCLIVECQKEVNKRVTVGEFFNLFGKYEGREECWKLKVRFSSCAVGIVTHPNS